MLESGDLIRGRYRVSRSLGRGGMADVYLALDTVRQAQVALKVLREDLAEEPEFTQRFAREAQALAKLEHPNIVRFYSFETDGPVAVIVMDYVAGERTLRTRLREANGPLPLAEVTEVLHQAGSALQYAHRLGFVHRDIKPANIMLKRDGTALLADFGIARAMEATTATQGTLGTPAYMSPEQVLGRELDQRSDVYSLGVVLFELLSGRRPFNGDTGTGTNTTRRIQDEHLHAPVPDVAQLNPGVPPAAGAVVLRAMAKAPEQRWPDVGSLIAAWDTAVVPVVRPAPDMVRCSLCGVANRRTARFCVNCGRGLGGQVPAASGGPVRPPATVVTPVTPGTLARPSATVVAPLAAGAQPGPRVPGLPQRVASPLPLAATDVRPVVLGPGAPAGNGRRLVAWLIDSVIGVVVWFLGVTVAVALLTTAGIPTDRGSGSTFVFVGSFGALAAYFVLCWGLRGATLGRLIVKQRLITAGGGKPGIGRALVRYVVMVALMPLLGLPWWPILWRDDRRGVHDLAAGTWPVGRE